MRKLLVANRGEIAVRIIASAALEGLSTVAVYTADDRDCAHVARADEAVALPGTGAAGYLDIDAVIAAAVTAGADAIHPGYGFLAESADFARQCAERLVAFVGPPPQALEAFGDKSRARAIAAGLGIPVPRGTDGPATLDEVRRFLDGLGPGGAVMVKAVAGGGGRGMAPVRQRRPAWPRRTTGAPPRPGPRSAPPPCTPRSSSRAPGTSRCRSPPTPRARCSPWATGTARCSAAARSSSRSPRRPGSTTTCAPGCTPRRPP